MTDLVRPLWQMLEPLHAVLYYAPEVVDRAARLGYDTSTRWPGYFAWRAAPLGAAGPELVAATFYSFSPAMVREHVPAIWDVAKPDDVLAARAEAVAAALSAILGDQDVRVAADLARELAESTGTAARPLGAANAELPWPADPRLVLWQAATILRETRGDGHVAALLTHGLDPVESLVSFAAIGAAPVEVFASRGWTDEEWAAGQARLVERGWLTEDGVATETGRAGRADVERMTDDLAAPAFRAMGDEKLGKLAQAVMPLTTAVVRSGLLPQQSTLGIGR